MKSIRHKLFSVKRSLILYISVPMYLVVLWTSCDWGESLREEEAAEATTVSLRFIGLDGASWDILHPLMRMGKTPNLTGLSEAGAWGTLESIKPMLSPRIWTSAVTGVSPERHGIEDFAEKIIVDGEIRKRLITGDKRLVPALWNIFNSYDLSSSFVAWWASWPSERVKGTTVSSLAWPFRKKLALRELSQDERESLPYRTYPAELMQEIEFLNRTGSNIPEEIMNFLQLIPEDWFYARDQSYANHAKYVLEKYQPQVFGLYLQGIDACSHPYWPDKIKVSRYYRYSDSLLESFISTAQSQTHFMIISDHGFQMTPGYLEALEANENASKKIDASKWRMPFILLPTPGTHHLQGIILAAGPQFRQGRRIQGNILQIAPTLMTLFDLPTAEDWSEQPLYSLFSGEILRQKEKPTVATYGKRTDLFDSDSLPRPPDEFELMDALKNLGYKI